MINTAIIYNHRGRFGADGTGPVEVRVTVDRKPYYINTGVRVRAREFKFGRVVNVGQADALNDRLAEMLERVDMIVNECLQSGKDIDVADVRRRVWSPDNRRRVSNAEDVLGWCEDQIGALGVRPGTAKHYKTTLARLAEFGEIKKWQDLSVEMIHRWDGWLHGLKRPQTDAEKKLRKMPEPLAQGTIRNFHKDFRALLSRALKFGIIQMNPYDRMRGEIKRGDHERMEFLTDEERDRLESLPLKDGLMLTACRDMFLFQCYTGMAYSDMQTFGMDDCRHEDGKWMMAGQRTKTGVPFYVQLLTPAVVIVPKYGGELPKVAVQVYNRNLKTLAQMADIDKRMTSHVARHTFATWALRNGVPIERVSKMLGHTNIKQTQRYAKVLAQDVFGEFDKLEITLNK